MKYSQNNEQQIIAKHFTQYVGSFLDIGANDGKTLSNTHDLALRGWSGTVVEPAPLAYSNLCGLYLHRDDIHCYNLAISDYTGKAEFWDSGSHLSLDDCSLLSSLNKKEIEKWKATTEFRPIQVDVVSWQYFLAVSIQKTFDVISIDAEGQDYTILKQMDLRELQCQLLIVEFNGVNKEMFDNIVNAQGFHLIHQNAENLIYSV